MESLSETLWDVVIEGTGLRQSLLALALSRSSKKLLHVDQNEYYGGSEAAFSLQEVDEWVEHFREAHRGPFRNVSLWKSEADASTPAEKLSFSRAYTLTLSSQIIYTKSKLLAQLVSSKVYRQLEFQAVGNWWVYDVSGAGPGASQNATLKRLPNGREDIFEDRSIDNRAKRSLMKFLKFVVDYESHTDVWEAHAESSLPGFLASQFQLPPHLQAVILALTLSLDSPEETTLAYSLPRIARHLTSIGVFGPGFGAVVPKWGGGAEIAQVACRAGAVGGGVYVLGSGIKSTQTVAEEQLMQLVLSNSETVKTKHLTGETKFGNDDSSDSKAVSKAIAVASSPLTSLFESSIEGSPLAAVSVIVFPAGTLASEELIHSHPIYIMAHSSETGECPAEHCVLYATTHVSTNSKALLHAALEAFLKTAGNGDANLLYNLYYEQQSGLRPSTKPHNLDSSLDLAFNDEILDDVEEEWKIITENDSDRENFMQFEERAGMGEEDDNNDNDF